jgi:hypothetical protein
MKPEIERRTERREVGEGKETKWITGRVSS